MGVRFPSIGSTTVSNALPANATETIICTLPPINVSLDFSQIILQWFADILAGATTTALVFRIRRGLTVAGALIGAAPWTHTLAAAATAVMGGTYFDNPGATAAQQYVLTCVQTAATGAGTVNDVSLIAFAL